MGGEDASVKVLELHKEEDAAGGEGPTGAGPRFSKVTLLYFQQPLEEARRVRQEERSDSCQAYRVGEATSQKPTDPLPET